MCRFGFSRFSKLLISGMMQKFSLVANFKVRCKNFSFLYNKTKNFGSIFSGKFLHRFDWFEAIFLVLRFFAHP